MPFSERTVVTIDELVAGRRIDTHPTLQAWRAGELSRDELRSFAATFYHLVDALPRVVARTHSATREPWLRRPFVAVLETLDGASPTPSELWLQTCAALGLFSRSVRQAPLNDAACECVELMYRHASTGPATGTAVVYALLRELPAVCRVLQQGLREHYGMESAPGTDFFEVFPYCASDLSRELREVLMFVIRSDEHADYAQAAASDALDACERLLSEATQQVLEQV